MHKLRTVRGKACYVRLQAVFLVGEGMPLNMCLQGEPDPAFKDCWHVCYVTGHTWLVSKREALKVVKAIAVDGGEGWKVDVDDYEQGDVQE